MRSTYCGRLDPHDPHEWVGRDRQPTVAHIIRDCPGAPLIEGGHPANDNEIVEPLGPRALALAKANCGYQEQP